VCFECVLTAGSAAPRYTAPHYASVLPLNVAVSGFAAGRVLVLSASFAAAQAGAAPLYEACIRCMHSEALATTVRPPTPAWGLSSHLPATCGELSREDAVGAVVRLF
jgi:hypothetical protein